jgi:hypothetical protein
MPCMHSSKLGGWLTYMTIGRCGSSGATEHHAWFTSWPPLTETMRSRGQPRLTVSRHAWLVHSCGLPCRPR